jgi:hypothetical protein
VTGVGDGGAGGGEEGSSATGSCGAGAGGVSSPATTASLVAPESGNGCEIRSGRGRSEWCLGAFGFTSERVSSQVLPTCGKTLDLPIVVSSVAAAVGEDLRCVVVTEPPKKTWRALRVPPSAWERTASTGRPIVSQRTTTSGTARRIGSTRARERRDRFAPGSRLGKSMYERRIELLFRTRKRLRGLSVGSG